MFINYLQLLELETRKVLFCRARDFADEYYFASRKDRYVGER